MVGQQNADIADTLRLRGVAIAAIFLSCYIRVTLVPTWIIRLNHLCVATIQAYVKIL